MKTTTKTTTPTTTPPLTTTETRPSTPPPSPLPHLPPKPQMSHSQTGPTVAQAEESAAEAPFNTEKQG